MIKQLKGFGTASLTACALGALLAAQTGTAAEGEMKDKGAASETMGQSSAPAFSEIDSDGDGSLEWRDLESEFDDKLEQANWDREQVFTQFDMNQDQSFDEQEYDSFQTALNAKTSEEVLAQQEPPQDQQQQTAQSQQGQDMDSGLLTMPVDQVTQSDVVNSRGEEIGSVSRIVRDNRSGNLALVIESGGVLGLGGSTVLVNLAEVSQMGENQLLWDTMLSKDEIAEMPEFDESEYTEVSEAEFSTLREAQERG
ncbi:EF-hand domain-containing protein [Gilvimarinus sp. F26214L]|uniref:EF-hand domain-containing protein n=1 Tax=Gilvimarinus sp. DZF01 TaxID=3461371 RepID=UPI0040454C02